MTEFQPLCQRGRIGGNLRISRAISETVGDIFKIPKPKFISVSWSDMTVKQPTPAKNSFLPKKVLIRKLPPILPPQFRHAQVTPLIEASVTLFAFKNCDATVL